MVISFSCSASTRLAWILALLLIVTMIQVHAQSPSGFVSIDCGWINSNAYVDNTLGLPYSSDGDFVDGGLNHEVLPEFMDGVVNDQQKTLRSFPDGSRNCYTLPSTISKKYLLRATFTYGNYDRLNKTGDMSLFLFGLHIGVNFWEAVNLTNWDPSITVWKEVVTVAPSNSLSVCLVNFGSGIPFISSLELRLLQDTMYPFVNSSLSISYFQRIRFGDVSDFITRYPTDNYDRWWQSWSLTFEYFSPWISLHTSSIVKSTPDNDAFSVPLGILQKASTLDTNYSFMKFYMAQGRNLETNNQQLFLPIFHFAEINVRNPHRRFDIYINDVVMFSDFSPSLLQVESKYYSGQFKENASASISLRKTASSSLPPLINAFEVYSPVRMENLTTDSNDVNFMKQIKTYYSLPRINWNGDPCSPREYSWEDLTCEYSKSNQNPRIVTINLSTSGLIGGIAISFMNMVSLENLDLSHNNLTGAIPDYQLNSLKVLNLTNNQLSGPIPYSVLQRYQAGLLDLRFGMRRCTIPYCTHLLNVNDISSIGFDHEKKICPY